MRIEILVDEGSSKEDAYLVKDNVFGVFDGAGCKGQYVDSKGRTGALLAAQIARDVFAENKGTLKDMLVRANEKIRKEMLAHQVDANDRSNAWTTTASVVRLKGNFFEWIRLNDSPILAIRKDCSFKLFAEEQDHDRHLMLAWKKLALNKKQNISQLLEKEVRQLRLRLNEDYGGLDGEEKALKFLERGKESLESIKHVLLFTDGLFLPKEDPEAEDDWQKFAELYLDGGLKGVCDYVRSLESEDPNCWRYPRCKQHDDTTAIALSF